MGKDAHQRSAKGDGVLMYDEDNDDRERTHSGTFEARFGSTCGDCEKSIHVGDIVHYTGYKHLVHVQCPLIEVPATRYGPLCPTCRLYHQGDCW